MLTETPPTIAAILRKYFLFSPMPAMLTQAGIALTGHLPTLRKSAKDGALGR
jgi:hypothetical protein